MLDSPTELWISSFDCATNCSRKSKSKIINHDSCYIKYDLYEPIYEKIESEYTQIGITKDNKNKYFRYTTAYFFDNDFSDMLKEAEEIEITFNIMQDNNSYWDLNNSFNNNIILKGHSFENQNEMIENWNSTGIDEFKFHTNCPYYISAYDSFINAIQTDSKEFTFKLNKALIEEFKIHNIKGFHLYCHDSVNGSIKIDNNCKVKVTRFISSYTSKEIILSKESTVVKNKRIYNDDSFLHAGAVNYHNFFMFENDFEETLKIANEIEITFNLLWFLPSEDKSVVINVNNNYLGTHPLKDSLVLTGHCFKNFEDLSKCKTKEEFFELNNLKHYVGIYKSFKAAIENGNTSFTIKLNKDDIFQFLYQGIKGFRIGLNENGTGFWRMSKICTIKVTEFKDEYEQILKVSETSSWININSPTFIGKKDSDDVCYSAFYFFRNLKDDLNKGIENVSVRFYFDDYLESDNSNEFIQYYLCYHDFDNLEQALEHDQIPRKNTICSFKSKRSMNPDSVDIILNKEQIIKLKKAKGLCVYSKNNDKFTVHGNKISIFINYLSEGQHVYSREFEPIESKTYIIEDKKYYNKFICGSTADGYLYKPFVFLGDNFYDFLNKETTNSIQIIVTLENYLMNDGRRSRSSLSDISFYTHNITSNDPNYNAYKYIDHLFTTDSGQDTYYEIYLSSKEIEILKQSHGLGAFIHNNIDNDFVVIKSFKIIVNYTR